MLKIEIVNKKDDSKFQLKTSFTIGIYETSTSVILNLFIYISNSLNEIFYYHWFLPFLYTIALEDMLCICKCTIKCDNIENTQNTQMEKYLHLFVHVILTLLAENKVIDIKD